MYCKNCGKEIEQDSKFCKYCGGSVSPVLNSEPDTRPDLPAKQKTKRGFGFIVVLLLVAVALFPIFFNQPSVPASKTQPKKAQAALPNHMKRRNRLNTRIKSCPFHR